ncbi:MAG: hypothetical protein K8H84_06335 [Sulfuricella denitrificans]|nr:hypothetical protein [Sulfuricella denitrificans]
MSQLEIHIPENWPQAGQDKASETATTPFSWCLRGAGGKLLRAGRGTAESMPAADICHIVLPSSKVLLSSIKPPAQNRRKFMQALPYAIEDRIMADPESIHVAPGNEQENGEIPLAIVDRAWLGKVLDELRSIGLKPVRAEVETLLAPFNIGVWNLIWRGNGGFVRQGQNSGMPLDGGDAEHPPAALLLAIKASDNKPGSIQIHLDGAEAPDLGAWSSGLGIPVTSSGEWQWPASAEHGINLLQGGFAPGSTYAKWLPRLRPALVVAGLILGLHVIFTIGDWARLRFEKQRLTTSMEQSFRKAFPDAKVIVDAPLQMRRNLAELRHSAGIMDHNDFLPLLAEVAPMLGVEAQIQSLEYQQGILKMHLILTKSTALESLRVKLPQAKLIPGNSGPNGIEAELTIGKPS